jgi:hypothetical protein
MLDNVSLVILIYFPISIFFLWSTPPISCLPGVDIYYFFRLINHKSKVKTSVFIHHISVATFAKVMNRNTFMYLNIK